MELFRTRLRQLRKAKNLSQGEISKELNIVQRSYRRYESGETEPTLSTVIKLADFFGVSLDYLAGRTEE